MKKTIEEQISDLTLKLLKLKERKEAAWLNYCKKITALDNAGKKYRELIRKTNDLSNVLRIRQASLKSRNFQ